MFESGRATVKVMIQNVVNGVDGMGAPVRTYTDYLECWVQVENRQIASADSNTTGPREESIRSATFIARNHPSLNINTSQRIVVADTGEIMGITAVRYDQRATTVYMDVQGGGANG